MNDRPMDALDNLLDGQKVGPRMVLFLAIATLAMLADGYDIAAIGLVAPELVRQWHVTRAALAPNLLVMTAEVAPKRVCGGFLIIILFGVPCGIRTPVGSVESLSRGYRPTVR
jgi:hypothetical protein